MKLLGGLQQRSLFFIPRHEGGKCRQVRGPLLTCHSIHKLTVQVRQARSLRPVIYLGQVSMFPGKTQNEQCGITRLNETDTNCFGPVKLVRYIRPLIDGASIRKSELLRDGFKSLDCDPQKVLAIHGCANTIESRPNLM
jgi:hypothetical protein